MRNSDNFDDAWRCIGEAMTAVETTKETMVRGRGQSNRRGSRTDVAGTGCREGGSIFRARARSRASAAGKVLGTARGDEHGAALARSREAAASSRTARSVYGWFTEGFDTLDLKEAKALLDELPLTDRAA